MLNALNERIAIAKANLRQRDKLCSMLGSAKQSLAEATNEQSKLKKALAKEQSDVDALEGMSITGLFHAILGSKEQRLEKERQELVAVKLKVEQAAHTVEHLKDDVRRLQDALSPLQEADQLFQELIDEKEECLAADGSDTARNLVELSQQIADLAADRKELVEAADAGQAALRSVKAIQGTLASAANWGALDMFGGGMLTTMVKHSKMDAAKDQARTAQRKLLRFQEELADADHRLQVSLQIGGFAKFADYFFDGLIADWVVQSKIQKAKTECSRTVSQVSSAIRQCQRRLETVNAELSKLNESKRDLIESA